MGLEIGRGITIDGEVNIQFEYPLIPTNLIAPTVTGNINRGSVLSTNTGSWQAVPDFITYQYQWQRGTSNIAGATGNTYLLANIDVGSTIRSSVIATNVIGTNIAYSANTAPILPALPNAPTSVVATSLNSTSASVTWVAPTDNGGGTITSYTIVATSIGRPTIITSVAGPTSGTITGLVTGGLYEISVAAVNAAGTGAYGSANGIYIIPAVGESYGGGIVISATSLGATVAAQSAGISFGNYSASVTFCQNLVLNGYSDWFMPNQTQLNSAYSARSYLGTTPSGEYWSSTVVPAVSPTSYYTLSFPGGLTSVRNTTFTCYVRAIRGASY
jgi:hypothetical protein